MVGRRHHDGRVVRLWCGRMVCGLVLGVVLVMACHNHLPTQDPQPASRDVAQVFEDSAVMLRGHKGPIR